MLLCQQGGWGCTRNSEGTQLEHLTQTVHCSVPSPIILWKSSEVESCCMKPCKTSRRNCWRWIEQICRNEGHPTSFRYHWMRKAVVAVSVYWLMNGREHHVLAATEAEQLAVQRQTKLGHNTVERYCCQRRERGYVSTSCRCSHTQVSHHRKTSKQRRGGSSCYNWSDSGGLVLAMWVVHTLLSSLYLRLSRKRCNVYMGSWVTMVNLTVGTIVQVHKCKTCLSQASQAVIASLVRRMLAEISWGASQMDYITLLWTLQAKY